MSFALLHESTHVEKYKQSCNDGPFQHQVVSVVLVRLEKTVDNKSSFFPLEAAQLPKKGNMNKN